MAGRGGDRKPDAPSEADLVGVARRGTRQDRVRMIVDNANHANPNGRVGWDEVLYSSGPIARALTGGPRSTHRPLLVFRMSAGQAGFALTGNIYIQVYSLFFHLITEIWIRTCLAALRAIPQDMLFTQYDGFLINVVDFELRMAGST